MFMHSRKIIHLDIKPENVVFSRLYKRFVFCDLGFCKMIKENLGYKTMTSFKGTLGTVAIKCENFTSFKTERVSLTCTTMIYTVWRIPYKF